MKKKNLKRCILTCLLIIGSELVIAQNGGSLYGNGDGHDRFDNNPNCFGNVDDNLINQTKNFMTIFNAAQTAGCIPSLGSLPTGNLKFCLTGVQCESFACTNPIYLFDLTYTGPNNALYLYGTVLGKIKLDKNGDFLSCQ